MRALGFIVIALTLIIASSSSSSSSRDVTATWIDAQRIALCSVAPGALIARPTPGARGTYVGDHPGGCVAFPPDGALIDVAVAPRASMVYCVATLSVERCADPLPPPPRHRVFLPVIARDAQNYRVILPLIMC